MFDGPIPCTETRDPETTDQNAATRRELSHLSLLRKHQAGRQWRWLGGYLQNNTLNEEHPPLFLSSTRAATGAADITTAKASGTKDSPVITAKSRKPGRSRWEDGSTNPCRSAMKAPASWSRTGSSDAAKALMGKTVSMIGGAMYAQYRTLRVNECMPLPAGTTAADGASWFVNPLTALGMTETMRREGHKALVHTAAASNLGQMLNKICLKDGIGLVNIVRSKEQADLLRKIGAKHVVRFRAELHGRPDRRAGRDRRHDRLRRDRRRHARGPNPHRHGGSDQQDREGL